MLKRTWVRILLVVLLILVIASAGFVIWASTPAGATMPTAQEALTSTDDVTVNFESWLVFTPEDSAPDTGFIFYPGGRVLVDAYAPMGQAIADAGYLVVMTPMPLNLAVLSPNVAGDVIAAYPDIENWVIGGHSLGGSMAATFTHANPDSIDGIVFMASYPQASDDLSTFSELVAASIYGTEDGLATVEDIENSRQYLPEDTAFVEIAGGNHAQFGWYGEQGGDNPATISREEQQEQIINAVLDVMQTVATSDSN